MSGPHSTARNDALVARALRALKSLLAAQQVQAIADQLVVSATSFVVFVMIARATGPSELGAYALAMSVLAFCLATQDSLVTRPYAIKLKESSHAPCPQATTVLMLCLILCAGFAVAAATTATIFGAVDAHVELTGISWALAFAVPFMMLREFARRFSFAHLAVTQVLMLDAAVAALTIAVTGLLWWAAEISAATVLMAGAGCCAAATLCWLWRIRQRFSAGLGAWRTVVGQSWDLGKWLLWAQLGTQAQAHLTPWLALVLGGSATAGMFAACAGIIAFNNPVIFGFANLLTPQFVRTLQREGIPGLRRRAVADTLMLGGFMVAFCLGIYLFGADLMRFLYGEAYAGHNEVLLLLALASLAATVGIPPTLALAATGRTRPVAVVILLTVAVIALLVVVLLPSFGLLGAAYGVLVGESLGAAARWIAFWLLAPLENPARSAAAPSQARAVQA